MSAAFAVIRCMRQLVGGRAVKNGAASASAMGRFETLMLDATRQSRRARRPARALDRCGPRPSATQEHYPGHGQFREPGARRSGGCGLERAFPIEASAPAVRVQPLGDLERCSLRPGNVHSAEDSERVPKPVLARYTPATRPSIMRRRFCADAAFAIPALFESCSRMRVGIYANPASRATPKLYQRIAWLMKRRPGLLPHHVVRRFTSFHYRAKSWPGRFRRSRPGIPI